VRTTRPPPTRPSAIRSASAEVTPPTASGEDVSDEEGVEVSEDGVDVSEDEVVVDEVADEVVGLTEMDVPLGAVARLSSAPANAAAVPAATSSASVPPTSAALLRFDMIDPFPLWLDRTDGAG
jgi:hypothetical protein